MFTCLLACLPPSYEMFVTVLEAQSESVPKWILGTERLQHEEQKQKVEKVEMADERSSRQEKESRSAKHNYLVTSNETAENFGHTTYEEAFGQHR